MAQLNSRPLVLREKLHPSINPDQISNLVELFYERISTHPNLGPVFRRHVVDDWVVHLNKMKAFWRSVLLRTGEYKGKPVLAHLKINGLSASHFQEWLILFSDTAAECFTSEAAVLVEESARRIATSLWLSRSPDPFASPPEWIAVNTETGKQPIHGDTQ